MEKKSKAYWETFPYQQQLFAARKHKEESLAQWAARLTKLGEDAGYDDIELLDKLLRDKFVTGLDPGPMLDFFEARDDLYYYTFKQILDMAFTRAAQIEKEAKQKSKVEAKNE